MTVPSLVSEQSVRDVIALNAASGSAYNADTIGSNIRAASWFLERATNRIFRDEPTLTLKFTTNGDNAVLLPGLRTASSILLNGATLEADSTYHLLADVQQTGVYLGVQFRAFNTQQGGGPWYLSVPDWWDRNLDHPRWSQGGGRPGSLPNDLVIAGAWGYTDATLPEPVRDATKRLAAWLTLRSDALLSGAKATDTGIFDLSNMPTEVQMFVASWKVAKQAVGL